MTEKKKPLIEYDGPTDNYLDRLHRNLDGLTAKDKERVHKAKDASVQRDTYISSFLDSAASALEVMPERTKQNFNLIFSHEVNRAVAIINGTDLPEIFEDEIRFWEEDPMSVWVLSQTGGPENPYWHPCRILANFMEVWVKSRPLDPTPEITQPLYGVIQHAYEMGALFRDAYWKINHEEAAANYYAQREGRHVGTVRGGEETSKKWQSMKDECLSLYEVAFRERGAMFLEAGIGVQAETIREIATRSENHKFKRSGKDLTHRWFKEKLEYLKSDGQLTPITKKLWAETIAP